MSNEQPLLPQAIGDRLRELRTGRGLRQEDVANRARWMGLDWTRATITAIETGDRGLRLEEFFALTLIYAPLQLSELFAGDGWVNLQLGERSGWTTPIAYLRSLLTGERFGEAGPPNIPTTPPDIPELFDYAFVEPDREKAREAKDATVVIPEQAEAGADALPPRVIDASAAVEAAGHITVVGEEPVSMKMEPAAAQAFHSLLSPDVQQHWREIKRGAKGDAERKAARKFGVSADLVSVVAFGLYGRSMSYERDERTTMYARSKFDRSEYARSHGLEEDHPSMRSEQAIRGHVTRTLLAEMKDMIEHYKAKE